MTIGERIRAARKAKGLTQKALGEACGIAEPTIRRYELGKLNPKFETLQKIAKPLGVSAAKLSGIELLSEDYLFFLEEMDINEMTDIGDKKKELDRLKNIKEKGLTDQQREQMDDPFSEVYMLLMRLGYTGYTDEEILPPKEYDPEEYTVCKNQRNNRFYISSNSDFYDLVDDIEDYSKVKLDSFFKNAVEYIPALSDKQSSQQPPQAPSPPDSETTPSPGETPPEGHTEQKEAPKQGGE